MRSLRFDQAWYVPRWISTSPGRISVSSSSRTAQTSPSRQIVLRRLSVFQRQPDERVGAGLSVEVATGRDDLLEPRRRDGQTPGDTLEPTYLLVEIPRELAPGTLPRVAPTVLRVDGDAWT